MALKSCHCWLLWQPKEKVHVLNSCMKHYEHINNSCIIRKLTFSAFTWYLDRQNRRAGSRNKRLSILHVFWSKYMYTCICTCPSFCIFSLITHTHAYSIHYICPVNKRKGKNLHMYKYMCTCTCTCKIDNRLFLLPAIRFWRSRYQMKAENVSFLMMHELLMCS